MRFHHRLTYAVLTYFSLWLRRLSPSRRRRFANRLAGYIYRIIPLRKRQALRNIQRAFPDKSSNWHHSILQQCYRFFIRNFYLFLALPESYHSANIRVQGADVLKKAWLQKKGVVLVSGHFGVWELLGAWIGYQGFPFVGIAARQKNRGSNKFFQEKRELSGLTHIFRRESLNNMYDVLNRGELLGFVSDQDAKGHGIFVNFFNTFASTHKGPALFHLRAQAPIIFTTSWEEKPNQYVMEFAPVEIDGKPTMEAITQEFTTMLENRIRMHPEQYFWFHRRWKTKKPHKDNV